MSIIIRDAKALKSHVAATLSALASAHVQLHVAAVSVLFHAAEFGETSQMTFLWNGLSRTYQDKFKDWLEIYTKTEKKNFVGFTKERGFFVLSDKHEQSGEIYQNARKALVEVIETVAEAKPFFEYKAEKDKPDLTDAAILAILEREAKKASGENAALVSPMMKAVLEAAVSEGKKAKEASDRVQKMREEKALAEQQAALEAAKKSAEPVTPVEPVEPVDATKLAAIGTVRKGRGLRVTPANGESLSA